MGYNIKKNNVLLRVNQSVFFQEPLQAASFWQTVSLIGFLFKPLC